VSLVGDPVLLALSSSVPSTTGGITGSQGQLRKAQAFVEPSYLAHFHIDLLVPGTKRIVQTSESQLLMHVHERLVYSQVVVQQPVVQFKK
jgi:hypothetical protein